MQMWKFVLAKNVQQKIQTFLSVKSTNKKNIDDTVRKLNYFFRL